MRWWLKSLAQYFCCRNDSPAAWSQTWKGEKSRNKKATIADMIGNGVLGSNGFAMLPQLVQWAIFFAEKGDGFRNWIKWWQVWTSASLKPLLWPDIYPPNERRTETAASISGHLFQEHCSRGSHSCLQGNVLQISRNGCLHFNTFESTFLIANVDWLRLVYESGDFRYKLDMVLLAPALYSLCADSGQVCLEFVMKRNHLTCYNKHWDLSVLA